MLTGSNFEIAFGIAIISIIANITLKLTYMEHLVDFIFKIK